MILIIGLIVIWWILGSASFVYWFTKDHDITMVLLPLVFIAGVAGPISFAIGYFIHGDKTKQTVIFKKRNP